MLMKYGSHSLGVAVRSELGRPSKNDAAPCPECPTCGRLNMAHGTRLVLSVSGEQISVSITVSDVSR